MIINQFRTYRATDTTSTLHVDGEKQPGVVIEDVGRPQGVKIQDQTCIPEGVYKVAITPSARFKKPMMLLSNMPDGSIQRDDVRFTGIRVHKGTNTDHTAGCPLYSHYEALQERVQKEIDAGKSVYWIIGRES